MKGLISYGYTTNNEKFKLEVFYILDSFWRKFLGLNTEYKFVAIGRGSLYNRSTSNDVGWHYQWMNDSGSGYIVTDPKILNRISRIVNICNHSI